MVTGNRIIIPKYIINTQGRPVLFLAGPVSCSGGWQNRAVQIIRERNKDVFIAVPDYGDVLNRDYVFDSEKSSEKFGRQLEWEQHYLEVAEKNGAILFWLGKQVSEMPISREHGFLRPYARDTRGEVGAWGWGLLRHRLEAHVAVGGEEGYCGLDVTHRNFSRYAPHIPFRDKLEDVCYDALNFCKN